MSPHKANSLIVMIHIIKDNLRFLLSIVVLISQSFAHYQARRNTALQATWFEPVKNGIAGFLWVVNRSTQIAGWVLSVHVLTSF